MPVTTIESWALDGLQLTSGAFTLMELTADPPKERQNWISAADSEAAALFRQPLHENRTITMKLRVTPQASMDAALDQVGALVDKLRKASSTPGGVALVWTPTDSARSRTFDVLTGEITGLPIALDGDGLSWLLHRPIVTVELTCAPYWRGTETLTSTASSFTPFVTLEVAGVTGDVPALGRLIVTDTATQSRRHVEWGLEGPATYDAATSLLVDSDDMVTSGFSGTQTTAAGAYDPNATGNQAITLSPVAGATTAMAGTGNLSHVGVFRVKARMQSGSLSNLVRFSWKSADGPTNHNDWVSPISTAGWQELDLGTITVPAVTLGTQRWTGQVEVRGAASSPGTVLLDYLALVPAADGYGKARAATPTAVGAVLTAYDDFSDTSTNLNAKSADLGAAWASSGVATDFVANAGFASRSTGGPEASPRFAVFGSAMTNQLVALSGFGLTSAAAEMSLIGRWTDANNHLRFEVSWTTDGVTLVEYIQWIRLLKVVASTPTEIARLNLAEGDLAVSPGSTSQIGVLPALFVYDTGRAIGQLLNKATGDVVRQVVAIDSVLATAGTLASGKAGIADREVGVGALARSYGPISVSTPPAESVAVYSGKSMQVRYDDTLRQDSSGTYYGRPPSYRGSRFLVPVGTSRVLVKARRNDIETALDDQVTDATQIQVGWTPRGLAVPR